MLLRVSLAIIVSVNDGISIQADAALLRFLRRARGNLLTDAYIYIVLQRATSSRPIHYERRSGAAGRLETYKSEIRVNETRLAPFVPPTPP